MNKFDEWLEEELVAFALRATQLVKDGTFFDNTTNIQEGSKLVRKTRTLLIGRFQEEVKQIEKAYGGCHNCYGKGYATVNDRWIGHDTDQDIGSPGGYVSGGNESAMKFCECDRGKQLNRLVSPQEPVKEDAS